MQASPLWPDMPPAPTFAMHNLARPPLRAAQITGINLSMAGVQTCGPT